MQVFGLPRHVIRAGALASRIAAKSLSNDAAARLDAVRRWHRARAAGLSADDAAEAVGVSRATLYRWAKRPEPFSRRPRRPRLPQWSPALAQAVEELRADNPMWGKKKLAWLLQREGVAVSASTVGRILRSLMDRGLVMPVPTLRRKPGGRRFRLIGLDRHARRLPRGLKPTMPGQIVQIDTVFVDLAPGRAVKHFTAYCPVARWTVAAVAGRATASLTAAFLDKVVADMPSSSRASTSMAVPSSWQPSSRLAVTSASTCSSCRQSGRSSTAPSSGATAHGDTSSMPSTTCPTRSKSCSPSSTPSPTATIITDHTTLSTDKPRPSI